MQKNFIVDVRMNSKFSSASYILIFWLAELSVSVIYLFSVSIEFFPNWVRYEIVSTHLCHKFSDDFRVIEVDWFARIHLMLEVTFGDDTEGLLSSPSV